MNENTPKREPQLDDLLGHFFDEAEVHMIFLEPDGRQFFLDMEEDNARIHGTFLAPGQTWARRSPPLGPYCDERKAIHEAGHAVICADEDIRVEYVTVVAHPGPLGKTFHGRCRYDYRLSELLKADRGTWGLKLIRANLGGPEAERIYWERAGFSVPAEARQGWADDHYGAKEQIIIAGWPDWEKVATPEAMARLTAPDVLAELERCQRAVRERIMQPRMWAAVKNVADKLQSEGAIDGREATQIVAACLCE
jgi:hypothetical protein